MNSFEFNKIAMATLGTIMLVMGLNFAADGLFHTENPEQKGYAVEIADGGAATEVEEEPAGPAFDPVEPLLASADASKGEGLFKRCAACHSVDAGGANKVGPALYDIVNRDIAAAEGFSYSGALKEYGEGKTWTYESLNGFLWKPKTYISGTSMGFAGLGKVEDRANLIAYLREQSDNPAPLPGE